ncbi:hypothetical protein D9M71_528120 [compost metagenome]
MVIGAEGIADIVQQRADDVFLVLAILPGAGRGLQGMGQAVDGEAAAIAFQQFQVGEDAVRQVRTVVGAELPADDRPVLGGTVFHVGEAGTFVLHHGSLFLLFWKNALP